MDPPTNTTWWKPNNLQYTYKGAEKYMKNIQSVPMNKSCLDTAKSPPKVKPKYQPPSKSNSETKNVSTSNQIMGQNLQYNCLVDCN